MSHGFRMRRAGSLAVAVLLAGCASRQVAPVSAAEALAAEEAAAREAAAAAEREARIRELHERLEGYLATYREGIDLVEAGEEVLGESRLHQASNGLADAAAACATISGCDGTRFVDGLRTLLDRQSISLRRQAARVSALESSAAEDVEREPGTSAFVASMPDVGQTVSLLRGTDLRDIIHLNGPVRAALDDWLTWMRPTLMAAWENYQFLRADIAPIYEEAGLPEALLFAMIATETGGKVHAYSRAGAAGPLQFMRHTGRRYGLGVDDGFDMRLDPVAATRANVAYLDDQFADLDDSLEKALAAYNGGENRIRSLHRRLGGASFWNPRLYYALPRETREYVPRVLAAAWLFLHPEEYNLELPSMAATTTELVLREAIALGELTVCLGQQGNPLGWFRTLRNLNPRLEPGERIEAGRTIRVPESLPAMYEERCLRGDVLQVARELHEANYPDAPEMVPYVVRRGDTLGRIASRHRCVSMGELAEINGIRPPRYVIHVGQRLKIPGC